MHILLRQTYPFSQSWSFMHVLDLGLGDLDNKKYTTGTATTINKNPPTIHIFLDDVSGFMFTSGTLIYLN